MKVFRGSLLGTVVADCDTKTTQCFVFEEMDVLVERLLLLWN
jgi:hypothetical protein